jgi:hypothetical protein
LRRNYKFRVAAPNFPTPIGSAVLGFLAWSDKTIVVNGLEPQDSQNTAIARLFARGWLDERRRGDAPAPNDLVRLERRPLAAETSPDERSADVLAAYLLMPPDMLEKYSFAPHSRLARLFIVPEEFLRWRLTLD